MGQSKAVQGESRRDRRIDKTRMRKPKQVTVCLVIVFDLLRPSPAESPVSQER